MKYAIREMPEALCADLAERLMAVDTATIGHMLQFGFMRRSLQWVGSGPRKAVGVAVTLALPGPDSALLHVATGALRAGDMLVIDRLGDDRLACLGGGVANAARAAGAVGAVIDGPCTDLDELAELDFPVWASGFSPITTGRYDIGGRMNFTVSCGGVAVAPGDIVLADRSGVVVLPREDAGRIADEALARQKAGEDKAVRVRAGERLGDISGAARMVAASLTDYRNNKA